MFFCVSCVIESILDVYIPTSVRLIREFRVAELKKSTRHRYTPPSVSCTFFIWSRAFLLLLSSIAKNRRSPKSLAIAECAPNFTFLSRESMLFVCVCVKNSKYHVICIPYHIVDFVWKIVYRFIGSDVMWQRQAATIDIEKEKNKENKAMIDLLSH